MNALLALPVVLPLLAASVTIILGKWRVVQRVITLAVLTTLVGLGVALLVQVDTDGIAATQAGGWDAPYGITLVADRLTAIMLTISAAVLLLVAIYAIGQGGAERARVAFHPVYLVLAAGVCLSFLTGDLFTLFVAFETMLVASYVLLTLGGRPDQVRSGMTYVVISLVASTLFVVSVAFIYAATGTVNMAELAGRMADLPSGVRSALAVLLLGVFGVKAGLFPLFFWLPDSYPTAPGPVTALFAGLLTKVGVYVIIRTQTLLFPVDSRPAALILLVGGLTMVVGVLGALAQEDAKRILSFHIISQIGYMIMGLGLFTVAGLAGAVFYIVHHIIVKTALFLVAGLIDRRGGSTRLSALGGLVHQAPGLALLFALSALSLAGLPPFSGFVGKFALVRAAADSEQWPILAAALAVGLLTLFSMTKIWSGAFWGTADEAPERLPMMTGSSGGTRTMMAATTTLVVMSVAVAISAGPLFALAERASADLLDPSGYIRAVLGGTP